MDNTTARKKRTTSRYDVQNNIKPDNSSPFESFASSSDQNRNYNEAHVNEFNSPTQSVYEAQHSFASGDFGRKGEWEFNEREEGGDFYRMDEMRGSGMEFGEPDRRRGTMYRGNLHDDSRGRGHSRIQGRGRERGHSEFRGRGRGQGPGQYGSARGWEGGRGGIQQRRHPMNEQDWKEEEFATDFDITKLREPEIFQFPTGDMATNLKESTTDMATNEEASANDSQEDDAPGDNSEVVKTNPVAIVKEQDPGKEEKKEENSKGKSINSESKDDNQMPSNNKTNKNEETEETCTDIAEDACKDQSDEDALEEEAMEAENVLEPIQWKSKLGAMLLCNICRVTTNSEGNFNAHVKGKLHKMNFDRMCQNVALGKSEPVFFRRDELGKSSFLEAELKKSEEEETYIGLSYVTEYQHTYDIKCICHLCASYFSFTVGHNHLTGFRHRMNVVREKRPDFYAGKMTLRSWERNEILEHMRPLIEEINKEEGPGTPTIKVLDDTILEVEANNEEGSSPDLKTLSAKYHVAIMMFLRKELSKYKIARRKPEAERAESGSRFQGKRPFPDSASHGDPRDVRGQHPRMHPPEPHGRPMHGPPDDPYFGHPHPPFLSRRHPMPDPDFHRPHYPPHPPIPDPYFRTRHMRDDLYHNPETLRRMRRDNPYHDRMPTDPRLDPDPLRLKTDEVYLDPDPLKRPSRSASYLDPDPVKRLSRPASYLDPDPVKRLSKSASYLDPDPLKWVSRAEVYSNRYNFDEPYIDPDPLKRVLPSQKAAKKPIVIDYAHGSEKKNAKNTADEWEKDLKDILTESKGPDSLAQLSCTYSSPKREDTPPTTPPRQAVKPLPFSKSYMERSKLLQQESNSTKKERSPDSRKSKDDRRRGRSRSPNRKYRCSEYRGSVSPRKTRHKSKGKGKTSSYDSRKHNADSSPRRHTRSRSPEKTGSHHGKYKRTLQSRNEENVLSYSNPDFRRKPELLGPVIDLTSDEELSHPIKEEAPPSEKSPEKPALEKKPAMEASAAAVAPDDNDDDDEVQANMIAEMLLKMKNSIVGEDADPATALKAILSNDITHVLLAAKKATEKQMENRFVGRQENYFEADQISLERSRWERGSDRNSLERSRQERGSDRNSFEMSKQQRGSDRSRQERGSDQNSLERSRQQRESDQNSLEMSRQQRESDRNSLEISSQQRGSDRYSLEMSSQQRGSDRNSLEMSRQERESDRNSLKRSRLQRESDRNCLERSRQERESDRNSLEMSRQERGSDRNSLEMSRQERGSDRNSLDMSSQSSLELERRREERMRDQENPKRGREVKIGSSRMQNELIRPKENPPPPPREKIAFAFSARSLASRSALLSFADEEEDD